MRQRVREVTRTCPAVCGAVRATASGISRWRACRPARPGCACPACGKIRDRCASTVFSLIQSAAAISLFILPSAARLATSSSAGVSSSRRAASLPQHLAAAGQRRRRPAPPRAPRPAARTPTGRPRASRRDSTREPAAAERVAPGESRARLRERVGGLGMELPRPLEAGRAVVADERLRALGERARRVAPRAGRRGVQRGRLGGRLLGPRRSERAPRPGRRRSTGWVVASSISHSRLIARAAPSCRGGGLGVPGRERVEAAAGVHAHALVREVEPLGERLLVGRAPRRRAGPGRRRAR